MKITRSSAMVMIAVALLAGPITARQQTPQRKPVPTFTDDDAPSASAIRSAAVNGSADSWSRANARWPQLKSLRARMSIDSPNGRIEALIEAVQPNRVRMKAGNGIELVTVGGNAYMKTPGTGWEKMPANSAQPFSFKGLMGDEFLKGGEASLVGAEKSDGLDTDVYDVTSAMGLTGTARVWIGKADGLPRRLAGTIGGGDGTGIPMVVTFYDFNKDDISIQAPM
jgi:hypothetical protein